MAPLELQMFKLSGFYFPDLDPAHRALNRTARRKRESELRRAARLATPQLLASPTMGATTDPLATQPQGV